MLSCHLNIKKPVEPRGYMNQRRQPAVTSGFFSGSNGEEKTCRSMEPNPHNAMQELKCSVMGHSI
jgi:hypothetical protein